MSTWFSIKDKDDIEVNDSDDTLEIYLDQDYGGAMYASVPMEFIRNLPEFSSLQAQIEELKSEITILKSNQKL